ncbi:MAG: hypothetical protein ABI882_12270 [Acidobacteriota bacterium]
MIKGYIITTGAVFGLITVVHIARIIAEGTRLLREPFWVLLTVISAALCVWAAVSFRRAR